MSASINNKNISDIYKLSPMQQEMYFHQILDKSSSIYFQQSSYRLEGALNIISLNESLRLLIQRYDVFRTVFNHEKVDFPLQIVLKQVENDIAYHDLRKKMFTPAQMENYLREFRKKDIDGQFDLNKELAYRISILHLEDELYEIIWSFHHILMDGWCIGLLLSELFQIYFSKTRNNPIVLPETIPYSSYIKWLDSQDTSKSEVFWKKYIEDYSTLVSLPKDKISNSHLHVYDKEFIHLEIGNEQSKKLKELSALNQITLYQVYQVSWAVLLSYYNDVKDIVFGSVVSGRPYDLAGVENIIGLFLNTVPVRIRVDKNMSYLELIKGVQEDFLQSEPYHYYPLAEIQAYTSLKQNLLDHFLVYENYPKSYDFEGGIKVLGVEIYEETNYDLYIQIHEEGGKQIIRFDYNKNVYSKQFIKKVSTHFKNIIYTIVKDGNKPIAETEILSHEEKQQLLNSFNQGQKKEVPKDTVFGLFKKKVLENPDAICIQHELSFFSYKTVYEKSLHFANYMTKMDIKKGDVVGLYLERSIDVIALMLGSLSIGAIYLPIDINTPEKRIKYVLNDSGAKCLFSRKGLINDFSYTDLKNIETVNKRVTITKNRLRPPIKEFANFRMPDRSLIDLTKYDGEIGMASVTNCISLQTTRGCPYECLFCHKIWSKTHVSRKADSLFEEIKYYYDRGVKNFAVIDDCFNLNIKQSSEFLKKIVDEKLNIQLFFPNGLRGDILTSDYIDLMVEAGTRGINLSLETASPRLQQFIKKRLNLDKFKYVVDYIANKHKNVILEMATMHGFPSETEEDAMRTLNFIKDIKWLHFPYIHILKIFPNTEMEEFALKNGISKKDIIESKDLAFHELPNTLPFPKSFTRQYQLDFLNNYFLSKERLAQVIPFQLEVLSESALIKKYNAYLPKKIESINDVLSMAGLDSVIELNNNTISIDNTIFTEKPVKKAISNKSKKILLLDLSQHYSNVEMLYRVAEQPLGLIYLQTYLHDRFGDLIAGKICKSGVDFDNFDELGALLADFQPDLIGFRTLTYFKDFFHEVVAFIKQELPKSIIITGGPYATSSYDSILHDNNVDLVILGEGESTFGELIDEMLKNGFAIPPNDILAKIDGIAYRSGYNNACRDIYLLENINESENNIFYREDLIVSGDDPAYIMYTSGSTGDPKGIIVENKQIINCNSWMQDYFQISRDSIIAQRTNLSFDPSVFEIYWPLSIGSSVRIIPEDKSKDAKYILDLLASNRDNSISLIYCPASMLTTMAYLLDLQNEVNTLSVQYLLIGAEPISMDTVKKFYKYLDGQIVNTYGPTECTINNTYYHLFRDDQRNLVPIGKPINNNTLLILTKDLKLLPTNISGEIYIGGGSVSRGYINSVEKTYHNFIADPFSDGILYKTGDNGRWLDDGNIEFLGRSDEQVKIRGYRIELNEIKNILKSNQKIEDCIITVINAHDKNNTTEECKICGISSKYPDIEINDEQLCQYCKDLNKYDEVFSQYFKNLNDLEELVHAANGNNNSNYDCILLYAGGKGSAYALYKLVELKLKVLVMTYDNGFMGKRALNDIKRIVNNLGCDHIIQPHDNSLDILKESMHLGSTVCRGCFHTSFSIAARYAYENNIKVVIGATLSRGQIIENKLIKHINKGVLDTSQLEKDVIDFQKLAVDINQNIFDLIGYDEIKDKKHFEKTIFVDFFRYSDITNEGLLEYLNGKDEYWKTKKNYAIYSTNCPIKQLGDYMHLKEKGFHYYGAATSWEKRLGHINLKQLREDLSIRVEEKGFNNFKEKIGYRTEKEILDKIDHTLAAYYIPKKSNGQIEESKMELRMYLLDYLPEYMVPSQYVELQEFPLTLNGKIDFEALPKPQVDNSSNYCAPTNPTEEKLAEIWSEVLGMDRRKISIMSNFFDLGGHSLSATIITSKTNKAFDKNIELSNIFKFPTIKKFASLLNKSGANTLSLVRKAEKKEYYKLSAAQMRLFIIDKLDDGMLYNMLLINEIEGQLDTGRLEGAIFKMLERHEALRTSFMVNEDNIPGQIIHEKVDFKIDYYDARDTNTVHQIIEDYIKPINIFKLPLFKIGLIKIYEQKHVLICQFHHIIADGVSVQLFKTELIDLYNGSSLNNNSVQFRDYIEWEDKKNKGKRYKVQEEFWLTKFKANLPLLKLPYDSIKNIHSYKGKNIIKTLSKKNLPDFKDQLKGYTINSILYSNYVLLLSKYASQERFVVGIPVSGRNTDDILNTFGIFINTLPIVNNINWELSYREFLSVVQNNILESLENSDYHINELISKLKVKRGSSKNPLINTIFALTNTDIFFKDVEREISELKIRPFNNNSQESYFDVALIATEDEGDIILNWEYSIELFMENTIERMATHYEEILTVVVHNPDIILKDIQLSNLYSKANTVNIDDFDEM